MRAKIVFVYISIWAICLCANAAFKCHDLIQPFLEINAPSSFSRNLFLNEFSTSEFLLDRQYFACMVLAEDSSLDGVLKKVLKRKLRNMRPFTNGPSASFRKALQKRSKEEIRLSALEMLVATFKDPHQDKLVRSLALTELAENPLVDLETFYLIRPVLRGVDNLNNYDAILANDLVIKIMKRVGLKNQAFVPADSFLRSTALKTGSFYKVKSIRAISDGNNVNATLVVTLVTDSGEEISGIFKPMKMQFGVDLFSDPASGYALKDRIHFTREVNAFEVFNDFFSHQQVDVPETLEMAIQYQGRSYGIGSFQRFADGFETVNSFYAKLHGVAKAREPGDYMRIWGMQSSDSRWDDIAPWIRVFDYVIGNSDRFPNSRYALGNPNNLMMKESYDSKKVIGMLIDNSSGRRMRKTGDFLNLTLDVPPKEHIPDDLQEIIRSFDEYQFRLFRYRYKDRIPKEGIDDMINRIRMLQEHISFVFINLQRRVA